MAGDVYVTVRAPRWRIRIASAVAPIAPRWMRRLLARWIRDGMRVEW